MLKDLRIKDPVLMLFGLASCFALEWFLLSGSIFSFLDSSQAHKLSFSVQAALYDLWRLDLMAHFSAIICSVVVYTMLEVSAYSQRLKYYLFQFLFICGMLLAILLKLCGQLGSASLVFSFISGLLIGLVLQQWNNILSHYDYQASSKISLLALCSASCFCVYSFSYVHDLILILLVGGFVLGLYSLLLSQERENLGHSLRDTIEDSRMRFNFMSLVIQYKHIFAHQIFNLIALQILIAASCAFQVLVYQTSPAVVATTHIRAAVVILLVALALYRFCFSFNYFTFTARNLCLIMIPVAATALFVSYFSEPLIISVVLPLLISGFILILNQINPACIQLSRRHEIPVHHMYSFVLLWISANSLLFLWVSDKFLKYLELKSLLVGMLYLMALGLCVLAFRCNEDCGTYFKHEELDEHDKAADQDMNDSELFVHLQELYHLTDKEHEILQLLAQGFSVPHIARELFISENTVKTHTKNLYVKLNVRKRDELISLVLGYKNN